ncbi:MAG: DUF4835 family protein [Bacteroidales bacterium]|nr:DUF4835 family protein [Bacteroidales bacterium]
MKKSFYLLLISFFAAITIDAQELNCQVSINSQQVAISDKTKFETLQKSIYEFMNNRQWTSTKFDITERIECSIYITFGKNSSGDVYSGSVQVQSSRPVYKSAFNSIMVNVVDNDFDFTWVEHDPLDFQINSFTSNLTSVLAYYAYIIIGTDFDSFSLNGGNQYFNDAQTIVNNAQNARESGWKSFEGQKNRYWLIENILNSSYSDYRQFTYTYHRLGLDLLSSSMTKGRSAVMSSLKYLQKVHRNRPGLYIMNLLMDAKRDEFIGVFSEAPVNEKNGAKTILSEIDPAHAGDYQKMVTGGK